MKNIKLIIFIACALLTSNVFAGSIAYIHGRVADNGVVLAEGVGTPFDQMLIDDSGKTGLTLFASFVRGDGHTITQFRDSSTNLNSTFLNNYDVVIFGLHQKMWSSTEKTALDIWIRAGGGLFIYSDSASGGSSRNSAVSAQNATGQSVTNNLISQYGMEVTVDQADGVVTQTVKSNTSISAIDGLSFQGEGVSPIAVAQNNSNVEILISLERNQSPLVKHTDNISIEPASERVYAALALRPLDAGNIIVMFDRQPIWNNGAGSDIEKEDNSTILREVVNFLAAPSTTVTPTPIVPPTPSQPRNRSIIIAPVLPILLDD